MQNIPTGKNPLNLCFSVGLIPENELTKEVGIKLDPITGGPIVNE
ncbi:unnamed protein product, partial [marine sediment metagenome]